MDLYLTTIKNVRRHDIPLYLTLDDSFIKQLILSQNVRENSFEVIVSPCTSSNKWVCRLDSVDSPILTACSLNLVQYVNASQIVCPYGLISFSWPQFDFKFGLRLQWSSLRLNSKSVANLSYCWWIGIFCHYNSSKWNVAKFIVYCIYLHRQWQIWKLTVDMLPPLGPTNFYVWSFKYTITTYKFGPIG